MFNLGRELSSYHDIVTKSISTVLLNKSSKYFLVTSVKCHLHTHLKAQKQTNSKKNSSHYLGN